MEVYSKYGKPNAILNIDSAYMKSRYSGKPFRYISMTLSNIYEAGVGGDLTLYYSNENILAKGELTKGLRSGLWSFYNEHGEKLETNFYERDSVEVDSLKHYTNGNYVLFNVQGDTIAKGRLLRGVDLYDCSSDLRVRDYDRTFKTFISNSGDSLVKNGEGYVKLYDEFNVLRMEGGISKELKHAEWKYYDPTGNINEVGVYVYGFKDGVWLKGDLRAVQYKDPDCFVQNSEYSKDKELQRVSIERIYYKMGIQEKSQKVNTYRRK